MCLHLCWKLWQVEIGGTRQELEDLREICKAEIKAARQMASAVVELFQTEPPVTPAATEHVDEIGELSHRLRIILKFAYYLTQ